MTMQELEAGIQAVASRMGRGSRLTVLTGAGVSAASGGVPPDFFWNSSTRRKGAVISKLVTVANSGPVKNCSSVCLDPRLNLNRSRIGSSKLFDL